jgi:lipoprotein signal peptidase
MPKARNRFLFAVFIVLLLFCQLVGYIVIRSGARYWANDGLPVLSETVVSTYYYVLFFAVLVTVLYFIRKLTAKNIDLLLALVGAGAASNLFDRVFRGAVMDYIDLWIWPSFNVADIFIVVGAVLVVVKIFMGVPKL